MARRRLRGERERKWGWGGREVITFPETLARYINRHGNLVGSSEKAEKREGGHGETVLSATIFHYHNCFCTSFIEKGAKKKKEKSDNDDRLQQTENRGEVQGEGDT